MMRIVTSVFLCWVFGTSAGYADVIKTNQVSAFDLSERLTELHQFDLTLDLKMKIKRAFSLQALSTPIQFQLKCGDSLVVGTTLLYDDSMRGKDVMLSFAATDIRDECPDGKFSLALNPNGVEIEVDLSKANYSLKDVGEDTAGFVERYKAEHTEFVTDMIYYHGAMSGSIRNRESFHCLIKGYANDTLKDEIVRDLVMEYKKIFSLDYVPTDIDCDKVVSLNSEILSCQTNARNQFCSNLKLYMESVAWLKDTLKQSRDRKAKLPVKFQTLVDDLEKVENEIEADLKTSVAQTGA